MFNMASCTIRYNLTVILSCPVKFKPSECTDKKQNIHIDATQINGYN